MHPLLRSIRPLLSGFFLALLLACGPSCHSPNGVPKPGPDHPTDSQAVLREIGQMGDLVYDSPEVFLRQADSLMERAERIHPRAQKERTAYQLLLLNIGYVLRQDGQILQSIGIYEQALNRYYKHPDTTLNFLEYYVKPLGSLYTMTGDIQKAATLQRMALAHGKSTTEEKAAVLANLAITIKELGLYDSVIAICREGLHYTSAHSFTAARHYNEMASSFLSLNQIDSAAEYNRKALDILSVRDSSADQRPVVWEANAWSTLGEIGMHEKNYNKAWRSLSQAVSLLDSHFPESHQRQRAKLGKLQGDLLSIRGDNKNARDAYQRAIALLNPMNTWIYPDYTVTDSYFGLAGSYAHSHQADSAIQYYLRAILNDYAVQQYITSKKSSYFNSARNRQMLKRVSDLLVHQIQKSQDSTQKQQDAFRMLWATELSKGRQLVNEISRTHVWNTRDTLSQRILTAQRQLRYLYSALAKAQSSEQRERTQAKIKRTTFKTTLSEQVFDRQYRLPDFKAFVKKIKAMSMEADVISWQMSPNDTPYVITVSKGIPTVRMLAGPQNIRSLVAAFVSRYFYNGPQAFNDNPSLYFKRSVRIVHSILPQFQQMKQNRWIISPDGIIYGLPLEALGLKKHFLIEDKRINSVYTLLTYRDQIKSFNEKMKVTVFAKPNHDPPFQDLKYIPEEIKKISADVAVNLHEGKTANLSNLQQALNEPNILHISTHAIADSGKAPSLIFDQPISLDNLQYILTQSPLVVLSACETAKGAAVIGEGMESLNKAFIGKGVKGVIAARWKVDDAFIPDFMGQFYALLDLQKDPAAALRDTKLYFIALQSDPIYRNPWIWASMAYTGNRIQLSLQSPTSFPLWYVLGGGIMAAGIGLYYLKRTRGKQGGRFAPHSGTRRLR